jgi:hypothetical protein
MLADWDEAYKGADQNEQVIVGRLNSIVVAILAAKRREEYGQHGAGKGTNKRTSTESFAQYKSLRWALEKPFNFKWKIDGKMTKIQGRMDFALWYGKREDLETNLVVIEAKRLHNASWGVPQAIIYMGKFPYLMNHGIFILITSSSNSSQSPQAGGTRQLAHLRNCHRLLGLELHTAGP